MTGERSWLKMKPLIEVKNLGKSFNDKKVLKNVSFDVYEGEILCLLGPNGAGKSTTINAISTTLNYEAGEILFSGKLVNQRSNFFKRNLGIVPQDLAIYEDISAEKNVSFFASLYGLRGRELEEKVDQALEFVGLIDKKRDKPKSFSGGMKRRLNIACALAHSPKIMIMDEPTVGIDPQSRNHILSSIKKLSTMGVTIIYTTHYMEEVEEISTRIIVMDHGEIIASGTKDELKEMLQDEKTYHIDFDGDLPIATEDFYGIEGIKQVVVNGKRLQISTLNGVENLDRIIALIINKGYRISNMTSATASLEMVFLKLTGRTLRN
jgi:ABC-2 type transport system ATP-binding protein